MSEAGKDNADISIEIVDPSETDAATNSQQTVEVDNIAKVTESSEQHDQPESSEFLKVKGQVEETEHVSHEPELVEVLPSSESSPRTELNEEESELQTEEQDQDEPELVLVIPSSESNSPASESLNKEDDELQEEEEESDEPEEEDEEEMSPSSESSPRNDAQHIQEEDDEESDDLDQEMFPSSEGSRENRHLQDTLYESANDEMDQLATMQSEADGDVADVDVSSQHTLEREPSTSPVMMVEAVMSEHKQDDDVEDMEAAVVQELEDNANQPTEQIVMKEDEQNIPEKEEMSLMSQERSRTSYVRERDEAVLVAEELGRQLQRREEELERVLAENSTLSTQLTAAINAKCEALLQTQNIASKELMLHHKEQCLEQQMNVLQSHNAQLTEQLRKQGLELAELRHSSETRMLHLERQLGHKTDELRASEEFAKLQKEKFAESEHRVEVLIDKLRTSRDSEINLQETHSQQIQSQTRLAQLYQEESRQSRALADQLSQSVIELQDALKEASEKFGDLETNSEREKAQLRNQLELRARKIEILEQELKNANMLLFHSNDESIEQQVSDLAPAAAVARKLVQSGLTLTQVYNQYASTIEELELRNAECKHLRESLHSIVKKLDEKAPKLAEDRETLIRAQQENERLLMEHDAALRQCDEIKAEAQQERKRACRLERDNARLESMINDLSKQVVVLVREVDAWKHGCAPPSLNLSNSYESYAGQSASQVLTTRLLPFRDVDELQKRNLELLAVVRELSDKAEAEEKAKAEGQDLVEIMSKLDDALQQLTDLQEREAQHARTMEQLIQQRDHYRELALQSGTMARPTQEIGLSPVKFDPTSPLKRSHGPGPEEQELRSKLKNVEQALLTSKQQYEQFRKECEAKTAQHALDIQKLKTSLEERTVANAKLVAACEHKANKLASFQTKFDELTAKLEAETKKTAIKCHENEKYHKMLLDMQNELGMHRSKLAESKATIATLDTELKRSKYIEMSLQQQLQSFEKSYMDRATICASIEEMKASFERSSSESNSILIKQLDEARLESRGLAKRLEEEGARLGGELALLQKALDTERAAVQAAQAETERAKGEAARVAERLAQAERDVLALRAHRNPNVDKAAQTELCVSEEVLREKRTAQRAMELEQQVNQLRSELLRAETRVTQLSTIVDASESALQQSRTNAEKEREEATERLREAHEAASQMRIRISELETQLAQAHQQTASAKSDATQQLATLQQKLEQAQQSAQQVREAEEACQALQSALEAAENEARSANEALALEVQKHAENKQLCSTLEQKLFSEQEALKALNKELEQSKQALKAAETHASERLAKLESTTATREQQVHDLQGQTAALLDQVQLLGAEVCALRQQQQEATSSTSPPENLDLSSSFSGEEPASVEQLLQVLRYLRSERNAAISNAEALSLQKAELQAQLDSVQQQLQAALAQGSKLEPGASEAMMRARYEELMRRVEVTSVLSESSSRQREVASTLRQENEELRVRNTALSQQQETNAADLRKATEQIETLQMELTAIREEAGRWRNCANQLTERASRANPEELKRLLQERENLQRQLGIEREELRKSRLNTTEREAELTKLRTELSQMQEQAKKMQDESTNLNTKLNEKEVQLKDIINKELQVRRIAKKYKVQFEELTKTMEEERTARQEEVGIQARQTALQEELAQVESKCQELRQQLESKTHELDTLRKENATTVEKSERARQVLDSARQRIRQYNTDYAALKEENTELKKSLAETQQNIADLQAKLQNAEQTREEEAVRKAALTTQFEGKIARLERELSEAQQQQPRQTIRQESQGSKSVASTTDKCTGETPTANIKPMPGPSQAKTPQGQQSATVPPTSRGAPMARLRPMSMGLRSVAVAPNQQQQAAAASSSSGVTVAPVQGVQVASSAGMSEASTSRQPAVAVLPMGGTSASREEVMSTPVPVAEPSTSQSSAEPSEDIQQGGQQSAGVSSGATVVLVRPQEVQPAVSSSQSMQSTTVAPPTSSQSRPPAPSLKRIRDESPRTEEPQPKHVRMEVTSASTDVDAEEEEPSSSLHGAPDEVIFVDSGDDTEEEEEEEEEEEVRDDDDDDEEVEGVDYPEDDDDDERNEQDEEEAGDAGVGDLTGDEDYPEDMEEDVEEGDRDMEDETEELEDDDNDDEDDLEDEEEPSPAMPEQDDDDDDNEVIVILDEPPALPRELGASAPEPTSSSSGGQTATGQSSQHSQAPLSLPLQQGFEEVGDDGIVPSTPTLSVPVRREGFGEGMVLPQVPQTQNQHFTFTAEPSENDEAAPEQESTEESHLESTDGTGRSVPSTPLHVSPQESVPCTIVAVESLAEEALPEPERTDAEADADQPSSSDGVPSITVTPAEEETQVQHGTATDPTENPGDNENQQTTSGSESGSPVRLSRGVSPRGLNRARRSGARNRPSNRPTPIVWDQGQSSNTQGMARGMPEIVRGTRGQLLRRARGPRPGFPPYMRHF